MSKRILVVAVAVIAFVTFGATALLYNRNDGSQTASLTPLESTPLVRAHSVVLGKKDAPVTIVEFFDPACEACRAFHPIVKQILTKYEGSVKVVLRYAAFHEGSDEAVRILEAARLQGLFEPVLEALLEKQPTWSAHGAPDLKKAWQAAGAAGLDLTRARKEQLMPEITATLIQDAADVKKVGVEGTPTFFVNGKPLPSFGSQQLVDLVVSEIEASNKN